MKVIYKRELKAYFQSMTGWLFSAITLFFLSLYFVSYSLMSGLSYISYALSAAAFIFIISIPILTMRILAEERKQKIDQLILTAPVSLWKVVMGKYLALATIFMIPMLIVCTYPLIMSFFGTVSFGENYISILGFTLYGLTGIALGLFISGITESQVIAAVLTLVAVFLTYMMTGITNMISSEGNMVTKVLNCFNFSSRVTSFYDGTFYVPGFVYYVSVTGLLLFFTTQMIQKRRYTVSTKQLKAGAYSSTMIVIVTVAVVFLNLMANELPESMQTIDMTSNKLYSITEETENFLEKMSEDITIYVMAPENNYDTNVQKTLNRYVEKSKRIKLEYKDPSIHPNFAAKYSEEGVVVGSLIVVGEKRHKVISYADLYESEIDYSTYQETTTGYDAEGQLTSALTYVTNESNIKVYEITGHGEISLSEEFVNSLTKSTIEVASLNLNNVESIPEDAECIIITAPKSDFSKEDTNKVNDYLNKGGNAMLSVGSTNAPLDNLNGVLSTYGISVSRDVVVETSSTGYYQNPFYILPTVQSTDITSVIPENYYLFMPYSVALEKDTSDEKNVLTTLLSSSSGAYAKVDLENAATFEKEENDSMGPFDLGVLSERTLENGSSKVVVYSSDSIFTDDADSMVSGANKKLFNSTVNTLADIDTGVSIPIKNYETATITVPQLQMVIISMVILIAIPVIMLVSGIVIVIKRRKR